jgi:hypothetical protein
VIRPTVRRSASVVVALLVVGGVSACTPTKSGAAAIVGDQSLSQITVNQQALDVLAVVRQSGQAAPDIATINQSIVSSWVTQHVLAVIAADHHVSVSDAEASAFLAKVTTQSGGQAKLEQAAALQGGTPPESIPDLIKFYLLGQKLPAALLPNGTAAAQNAALVAAVDAEASRLGVRVNPRYGQWDPKTGKLVTGLGQLSVPATTVDGRTITSNVGGGSGSGPSPTP